MMLERFLYFFEFTKVQKNIELTKKITQMPHLGVCRSSLFDAVRRFF